MNKQEIIKVAMATFYGSAKGSKIRGSVKKITDHLAEEPTTEWYSIITLIGEIIALKGLTMKGSSHPEFLERNRFLTRAIAEQILKRGDIPFMSHNLFLDGVMYKGQIFLAARFFAYVGSSLELTLQFCQLIFTYLIKQQESRMEEKSRLPLDDVTINVRAFIVSSMCAPALEQFTQKQWVNNIIEAADRGDNEATEYYTATMAQCVYANLQGVRKRGEIIDNEPGVIVISQSEFNLRCPTRAQQLVIDYENPRIVVADHLINKIRRTNERVDREFKQMRTEATGFFQWFVEHTSEIGARFDEVGNMIISQPRYGVRPMGHDSFLVNTSPLQCIGITSFSFYPGGEQFPNLKIMVTVKKIGWGLCEFWMYLRDLELQAVDEIFLNLHGLDVSFLRSVLEYIVIDALHRIVVEKPQKNLADEKVERPDEQREIPSSHRVSIRPFIRRLPIGFQASDAARQMAFLHLGWNLPGGMTFVRSHDRWAGLPAGKPAPLFKYTDDAIRKSIS
jgi:hypothetical protein